MLKILRHSVIIFFSFIMVLAFQNFSFNNSNKGLKSISVGGSTNCAIDLQNKAYCWGQSTAALGVYSAYPIRRPSIPVNNLSDVKRISSSGNNTCAIDHKRNAYCWGSNRYGMLGPDATTDTYVPVRVKKLAEVEEISVGSFHTCAIANGGRAYCWGKNAYGTLGDGTTNDSNVPVLVKKLTEVEQISTGPFHTCAIANGGRAYCWGNNAYAKLGDGTGTDSTVPVRVKSLTKVRQISAGRHHTCAIARGSKAYCWGYNGFGEVAPESTTTMGSYLGFVASPVPVANLTKAKQIGAGNGFSCAIDMQDDAYCWGTNVDGRLGIGSPDQTSIFPPTRVKNLTGVVKISVSSGWNACAIDQNRNAYCWGSGDLGQLGDDSNQTSNEPVLVGY